jgi:hypothetical protein
LSELTVEDAEQPGTQPSCRRTYLISVLHEAASLYSLSPEQIQALEQLLPAWVAIAALASDNPKDASRSPLAIDLAGDQGARLARTLQPAETLRYVDTSQLAPKLRELGAAIRAGAVPLEFAATRTLTRPATERLLTHLYIQWCSAGTGRAEERFASQRRAQVACNLHAIHFQISGRAFRQPGDRYSREEEHDLATFGHITGMTTQRLLTTRSSVQEPWEILNESAGGMLSMNRKPDLRSRIRHGQLVAMRTSSMEPPDLAVVQRLRIDADGSLGIGVRVIRSDVRAVAVRPAGNPTLKYDRALIVDADKERDTPAYLILAAGSCAVGSVLEVHTGRAEKLVITSILEQGVDHDRAAYKPA